MPRTRGWASSASRTARRSAPGPGAVHDRHAVEPGEQRLVEVRVQLLERGLDPLPAQAERRRHLLGRAATHLLGLDVGRRGAADRLGHDLHVVARHHQPRPLGLERHATGAAAHLHDAPGAPQRP